MAVADSTLVNVSFIIINTGSLVVEFFTWKGEECDVGYEMNIH